MTAKDLYDSLMLDIWPRMGAIVDFGLTQDNYPAYQSAIRSGKVTLKDLEEACGDGPKLTRLVGVKIETLYESMG